MLTCQTESKIKRHIAINASFFSTNNGKFRAEEGVSLVGTLKMTSSTQGREKARTKI
jgi:hypothetical protein